MTKPEVKDCNHEIGYKTIGGFPGHEHIHTTGEQICFNCGKTLKEILASQRAEAEKEAYETERKRRIHEKCETAEYNFNEGKRQGRAEVLEEIEKLMKKYGITFYGYVDIMREFTDELNKLK